MPPIVLDLDGTLVDSVPLHLVAWQRAFAESDVSVATAAVHATIGLGSSRLIRHLLGRVPDDELEQTLTDAHREAFLGAAGLLQPTPGATQLLSDLADRDVDVVVATSAGPEERRALLGALGDPDIAVTGAGDTGSTKPAPDPLLAAMEDLPGPPARMIMVGDAPWDGRAAAAAGIRFVAVRCGGFCDAALLQAGAAWVADDPAGLIGAL